MRDIATTTTGRVRLTLLLAPGDDPALARMMRQAVEQVEGVTDVTGGRRRGDAAGSAAAAPKPAGRALPVMDDRPTQPRVPAPTPVAYPNLGKHHRDLERQGRRRQVDRRGESRRRARAAGCARRSHGRRHLRAEHPADDGRERAADGDQRAHHPARGARREGHQPRVSHRSRPAGDLARSDRHEDHHAVPARRRVGDARLLHRRHAARHGRRAALARAGDAGHRRGDRHDAAGSVGRRRAARRQDVRARDRAGARHRREHELVRVSALRQAVADLRQRRRRAAGEGARAAAARTDSALSRA